MTNSKQASPTWIFLVLLFVWLFFMNGLSQVKQWSASSAPRDIVTTVSRGAQRLIATPITASAPAETLPTALVKKPAAPAARVTSADVVIPRSGTKLATALPTAAPTAALPASPAIQAIYNALLEAPTQIPIQACEAGNETFVTSPVTVLNPKGMPIGEARGRSCVSDQEANENANRLAQQVMDKDKELHPEAWK